MKPYYQDETVTLLLGDAIDVLRTVDAGSADCCVTSPPYYGLRDYGVDGQYGLEASPQEYIDRMVDVFAEVRRVLADDGTLWLNLGDAYSSASGGAPSSGNLNTTGGVRMRRPRSQDHVPPKNLLGMPWRVALALQADGWVLRSAIVWHKPNTVPSGVVDRLSNCYEMVFLLAPKPRYRFDLDAIREVQVTRGQRHDGASGYRADHPSKGGVTRRTLHPRGKNPGDVWSFPTTPYSGAHFATFPVELPLRCITAADVRNGYVLDPFSGTGTTGVAARTIGCRYVGIDLNPKYHDDAIARFAQGVLPAGGAA